jgi:phage/plasmid-like protein (TIGR03299 family)
MGPDSTAEVESMSKESAQWLTGGNILRGMTETYGRAWWYGLDPVAAEKAHYPGAIPVSDVKDRLFSWTAEEVPLFVPGESVDLGDGPQVLGYTQVPGRKAIRRSDNGHVMGIFMQDYKPHQYGEWLIDEVNQMVQGAMVISSAGLLKGGAVAWVQIEADAVEHKSGAVIRPHILSTTSCDGSLATTNKATATNTICDNTHALAMGEKTPTFRTYHTKYSRFDAAAARAALGLLEQTADQWTRELDALTETTVTEAEWTRFLEELVPVPAEKGRSQSMASTKQQQLRQLWNRDQRVAPWAGTAWGVVQAVNTHTTHVQSVTGMSRPERQQMNAVMGVTDKLDSSTLTVLDRVTAGKVTEARARVFKAAELAGAGV